MFCQLILLNFSSIAKPAHFMAKDRIIKLLAIQSIIACFKNISHSYI